MVDGLREDDLAGAEADFDLILWTLEGWKQLAGATGAGRGASEKGCGQQHRQWLERKLSAGN
jgi:hypothetical protein